jgi:hypothetical protein
MEIVNWVKEDGGGLFLLSHAGGDRGRNSNLSELSEQFGIAFENDQVLDEVNNIGIENLPIIDSMNFIPPHPITANVESMCYRAGCSLTVIGRAISIASSNETSEPFSCSLICTSEPENGRVCAVGSYEMFRDNTGGGMQYEDHSNLALNIFNWLISDYRMELTKQGEEHTIPITSKPSQSTEEITTPKESLAQPDLIEQFDASIQFSSREELMAILENYLNQINMMKTNLQKLIEIVEKSAEEMFFTQEDMVIKSITPTNPDFVYKPFDDDEEEVEYEQENSLLTALPPKPEQIVKKEKESKEDIFIKPLPMRPGETKKTPKTIAKPRPKEPIKAKEEEGSDKEKLESELGNLENKMNSVMNLIKFIEKKHDEGKLDDKSYKKQIKKLENDLDKTKKRIEEIKKNL